MPNETTNTGEFVKANLLDQEEKGQILVADLAKNSVLA